MGRVALRGDEAAIDAGCGDRAGDGAVAGEVAGGDGARGGRFAGDGGRGAEAVRGRASRAGGASGPHGPGGRGAGRPRVLYCYVSLDKGPRQPLPAAGRGHKAGRAARRPVRRRGKHLPRHGGRARGHGRGPLPEVFRGLQRRQALRWRRGDGGPSGGRRVRGHRGLDARGADAVRLGGGADPLPGDGRARRARRPAARGGSRAVRGGRGGGSCGQYRRGDREKARRCWDYVRLNLVATRSGRAA